MSIKKISGNHYIPKLGIIGIDLVDEKIVLSHLTSDGKEYEAVLSYNDINEICDVSAIDNIELYYDLFSGAFECYGTPNGIYTKYHHRIKVLAVTMSDEEMSIEYLCGVLTGRTFTVKMIRKYCAKSVVRIESIGDLCIELNKDEIKISVDDCSETIKVSNFFKGMVGNTIMSNGIYYLLKGALENFESKNSFEHFSLYMKCNNIIKQYQAIKLEFIFTGNKNTHNFELVLTPEMEDIDTMIQKLLEKDQKKNVEKSQEIDNLKATIKFLEEKDIEKSKEINILKEKMNSMHKLLNILYRRAE